MSQELRNQKPSSSLRKLIFWSSTTCSYIRYIAAIGVSVFRSVRTRVRANIMSSYASQCTRMSLGDGGRVVGLALFSGAGEGMLTEDPDPVRGCQFL
jgi:hypothetical protein